MNAIAAVSIKHLKDIFVDGNIASVCMESHEEVISRLKFIGHIQKDEKINVRQVNRQANTVYTKISRTLLYPDNRMNSLKFIKEVMTRSFEILEHYIHQNNATFCRGIITDILKARQGILNLKYTYGDDTKFCCDMDVIIENIASKINDLKENYPDLFSEENKSPEK